MPLSRSPLRILDFFAGSGTTFHATCILNAEDGERRRTILVTNNEVDEKAVRVARRERGRFMLILA